MHLFRSLSLGVTLSTIILVSTLLVQYADAYVRCIKCDLKDITDCNFPPQPIFSLGDGCLECGKSKLTLKIASISVPKIDYHCLTEQYLEQLPSFNRIEMNTCNTTEDFFREYIGDVYDSAYERAIKAGDFLSGTSLKIQKTTFLLLISTQYKESKVCRCNFNYCNELE